MDEATRTTGATGATEATAETVTVQVGVRDGASRSDAAVYVISVAAELAGVHPQTLRIYERRGLLDPKRTSGGTRRYSESDIARLRRIQDLTTAGVNLEGVRRILALERQIGELRAELQRTRDQVRAEVDAAHRQYRRELVPVRTERLPARWRP